MFLKNMFLAIISYSYPEGKKRRKYVLVQTADEMYKKKNQIVITKIESVPFTVA